MSTTPRAVAARVWLAVVIALRVIGGVRRSRPRRSTERRGRGVDRGVALLVAATALSAVIAGSAGCAAPTRDAPTSNPPSASRLPSGSASPTSSPSAVPAPRPTRREVVAAVKELAYSKSENVTIGAVGDLKLARDASGTWWASATVVPASPPHLDSVTVFIHKQPTGWVLFDMGTGIDTGELPPSVRDKL